MNAHALGENALLKIVVRLESGVHDSLRKHNGDTASSWGEPEQVAEKASSCAGDHTC